MRQTQIDEGFVARVKEYVLELMVGDRALDVAHPRTARMGEDREISIRIYVLASGTETLCCRN